MVQVSSRTLPPAPSGESPQAPVRVIALAGSAGGLAALVEVIGALPVGFPVPVLVVQHLNPRARSFMPEILARHARLAVKQAEDGERLRPGTVYVAPPDHHLLVRADGVVELTHTGLVRHVRPAADPLFCSLAASFGPGAVAVVLSGTGEDGADGALAVARCGGTVIAQSGAAFTGMPEAAIRAGGAVRVLPLPEIAGALRALAAAGEA
jgi:two-component system, chemotaxis family, protein-glutamate methylesterase/glutaminase